jgi:hypothetical protein
MHHVSVHLEKVEKVKWKECKYCPESFHQQLSPQDTFSEICSITLLLNTKQMEGVENLDKTFSFKKAPESTLSKTLEMKQNANSSWRV